MQRNGGINYHGSYFIFRHFYVPIAFKGKYQYYHIIDFLFFPLCALREPCASARALLYTSSDFAKQALI